MIVVDASVLANFLADDEADGAAARARLSQEGDLTAPDLVDVETLAVLRKRWLAGSLSDGRLDAAVDDLLEMPLARYPAVDLVRRAAELSANVTAYDAVYVALAEALDAPLLTADRRLAATPWFRCHVELLER